MIKHEYKKHPIEPKKAKVKGNNYQMGKQKTNKQDESLDITISTIAINVYGINKSIQSRDRQIG